MSPLPRVGITTYRERARWGVWDEPADLLPRSYADSVAAAGAVPLLLPPALPDLAAAAEAVLDGLHGLVIAGGADVDPARYGTVRSPHAGPSRLDRDAWELELLHTALRRGMPLLAICRGMQLLNVGLGGSLVQHLPDVVGTELHCPTPGKLGRHEVRLTAESRVGAVFGTSALVATYHHQGLARLAAPLVATGWADDGVIEAVELPGPAWVLGVQWHPEAFGGAPLFEAFATACVTFAGARAGAGAR